MAIAIDYIRPWTQLIATAGQTVFSTIWTADVATDILVYARTSIEEARDVVQLVSSDDYTVAFIGAGRTVQVTFLSGRAADEIITITRDTPADRDNLYNNMNFTPAMLNGDFFRLVLMIQQNVFYNKDLSPRYNTSETLYDVDRIIDLYLPKLPAKHVWRKNAENTRIEAYLLDGGSGGASETVIWEFTQSVADSGVYLGAAVRFDVGNEYYVPALADSRQNANMVAVVIEVIDEMTIKLQQSGRVTDVYTALALGDWFLSTTVPGGITQSEPQNDDEVSVPVIAMDASNTGILRNFRGKVIGEDSDDGPALGNGRLRFVVQQNSHGFAKDDQLYVKSDSSFALADATDPVKTEVAGTVVDNDPYGDGNYFILQTEGYSTDFAGPLTPGAVHYLDPADPGKLTTTKPTNSAHYIRPCVIGITTTHGLILQRWPLLAADDSEVILVHQASHGLLVGKFVRPSTSTNEEWVYAQANSIENATGLWKIIDADPDGSGDYFIIQQTGLVDTIIKLAGVAVGQIAYLSTTSAGDATLTKPTGIGDVCVPVYRVTDQSGAVCKGELLNYRPMLQPGADGGSGTGKDLLGSFTASGETVIDFKTIFSTYSGYKRYKLEWDNIYNNDPTPGSSDQLQVQVYITTTKQTSGYFSEVNSQHLGAVITATGSAQMPLSGSGSSGVLDTLIASCSGELTFYAPGTNGTYKKAQGKSSWGLPGGGSSHYSAILDGFFHGNTSPLAGFEINFASGVGVTGEFRVYGISE